MFRESVSIKIVNRVRAAIKYPWAEADLGLLQHPRWIALLKALHLGCCSNPRSASGGDADVLNPCMNMRSWSSVFVFYFLIVYSLNIIFFFFLVWAHRPPHLSQAWVKSGKQKGIFYLSLCLWKYFVFSKFSDKLFIELHSKTCFTSFLAISNKHFKLLC